MYNIAICDDDETFIHYMENMLMNSGLKAKEVTYFEFGSGEELLKSLQNPYDLLILDMQMKALDGNITSRLFRKACPDVTLVFCSGVCRPTVETFEVTPFRYLLKEYTDEKMKFELKAVISEMKKNKVEPFVIASFHKHIVKLRPKDILYIEIDRRGSCIHTCKEPKKTNDDVSERLTSKTKVSTLYEELKDYGFEYAHNSYIVNTKYVTRLSPSEVQLVNGAKLSVSRSKAKIFREAFAEQLSMKY